MKSGQADEVYERLLEDFDRAIGSSSGVCSPEKEVYEILRRVNWTVVLRLSGLTIPESVMEFALDRELDVEIRTDMWDDGVVLLFDNDEYDELEMTEEEKRREELRESIRSAFDLNRNVVDILVERYDSVDEIVAASRDELTDIHMIGERRADKILHRHSEALEKRIRETSEKRTIPVIEDEEGVLRLPNEYEDGDHVPKFDV